MNKSSIVKNIVLLFLIVVLILSASILTGCGSGIDFYIGDYLETDYFKYYTAVGAERRQYVCIKGLTDKGKELEYVVFPESIDGIPVTKIAMYTSDSKAKKAYIPTSIISFHVLNWTTVNIEPLKLIDQRFTYSLKNSMKTPRTYVSEYAEKVLVEKFNNFYFIANLCYLYNYEDSPNGGQWFVDDLDEGERIGYIPSEPVREGYKFTGWFTDKECTKSFDLNGYAYDPANGNISLYAGWIADTFYCSVSSHRKGYCTISGHEVCGYVKLRTV